MFGSEVAASMADEASVPKGSSEESGDELDRTRDPKAQYEILFPDHLRLRSDVLVIRWTCRSAHVVIQDDKPTRCVAGCREIEFTEDAELEERWLELKLAFTLRDIHRRKVYERIEHFSAMLFSNMLRHTADASLSPEWLDSHRGYLEMSIYDAATRSVLRETLQYLTGADALTIDGITELALATAAIALLTARQKRIDDIKKELTPTPAQETRSVSAVSTRS